MEEGLKGTVTPLSSLFPVEEAEKAAKRVEETINEKQKELHHLHSFISDNTNLLNLVQRLPDELFHDVMVPFGKAAFFPGRLIHTNEFLVLLGEGYYAEQTSKQTVEILQRRGKVLDSQVDSIKAMILDLKTEASFFDTTAAEAAEGLVEIREDYIEEHHTERMSNQAGLPKPDSLVSSEEANVKVAAKDDEYARVMARLDELEKEELAAESANDSDQDTDAEADFGCSISQHSFDQNLKISEEKQLRHPLPHSKDKNLHGTTSKMPLKGDLSRQNVADNSTSEDLKAQHVPEDDSWHGKTVASNTEKYNLLEKSLQHPESKKDHVVSASKTEGSDATRNDGVNSQKAFTGSIIEHTRGIQTNLASSQSTGSNPSKPVSRFKMQKGGR